MEIQYGFSDELEYVIFRTPSNFHAHLRTEAIMRAIAHDLMRAVKYLLVMPNDGLIDSPGKVTARFQELISLAEELEVNPWFVMTVYLTPNVTPQVIEELARLPFRVEVKYYPPEQGATTGSGHGLPLTEAGETLRAMAECGMPLLGHFESVKNKKGQELPHNMRETYFAREWFPWLREENPNLFISFEHVSTREGVICIERDDSGRTIGTFTPHHAMLPIEDLMRLSWANFGKCMPIPKGVDDVNACREFVISGDPRAAFGDDTAAHLMRTKQGSFAEAANGAFWTAHSIAAFAKVFEEAGALDERFENFMSINGAKWRGLPLPKENELIKISRIDGKGVPPPIYVPERDDVIVPLGWTIADDGLDIGLEVSVL